MSTSPNNKLIADLQEEIAKGRVFAIVGAGVSMGSTQGNPHASWTGLLKSGVDECLKVAQPLPKIWEQSIRAQIESEDLDTLLLAAEGISRKLGAPTGGNYRTWLRQTVGTLQAKDRSVLEALRDLDIPLATTNYDPLLTEVTGRQPVTWRDGSKVERVIRGEEQGILHLHGYWDDPESVILDIRSYEKIKVNVHAQNILHVLRTMWTLVFIGCGDGLADPNFATFRRWAREVFAESEYPCYRLCLDSETDELRHFHAREERILLLPYGPDHIYLTHFLNLLKPARSAGSAASSSTSPPTSSPRARRLPPSPRIFGREDEIRALVDAILATPLQPVMVLGHAGMGKSTLTQAALHHPRVVERFRERRYFVRCEGATTRDALSSEIALTLGLEPGPDTEVRFFRELERAPALLVLDNTETPWEKDKIAVDDLLSMLGAVDGVSLVASIRGEQRPLEPNWREAIRVEPLSLEAARDAFLAIAGERYRSDPDLEPLLQAMDRLPLAITLLAYQAEGEPDLANLWGRWRSKRTALLQYPGGRERLNLKLSLELSIQSPRMTESAKRLLSLLGLLPDGIAREDLLHLLPEEGNEAASVLRKVGLAMPHGTRLRVLAPVREHVQDQYRPTPEDLDRVMNHYLKLAELGELVGAEGGAEAIQRLAPETGNLEVIVLRAIEHPDPNPGIQAAQALGELFLYTGLSSARSLEQARLERAKPLERARQLAASSGNVRLEAACIELLGDISFYRSDHDDARALYDQALPLYKRIDDLAGEANCLKRLGNLALEKSDHDNARAYYEQAIPLYKRLGDRLGESNCIKSLGDTALAQFNHSAACTHYEQAIPLYEHIGDLLGKANCIRSLGDIALARFNYDTAYASYNQAILLYQRAGSLLGEANCIRSLGDIYFRRCDYQAARLSYEQAIPLFQRVGNFLGEANCLKGLGSIALERSDYDRARSYYEHAIPLFRRVRSLLGEANCIKNIGDIALRRSELKTASTFYKQAVPLYQRFGSLLGEANCIQGFGDIAMKQGEQETARDFFNKARDLYEQAQAPHSIGWAHVRLARIAAIPKDRDHSVEAARAAWTRIKRPDLVELLRQEFGISGSQATA